MRQAVYNVLAGLTGPHTGRVWATRTVRAAFEHAVKTAGLDTPLRFHDLRHHFAPWYVIRGGALPALQQILGHATLTMTMRYSHMSPEAPARGDEPYGARRDAGSGAGSSA